MSNESDIRRVGLVFAGGPAPAANAVISAATMLFAEGREVIGFFTATRTCTSTTRSSDRCWTGALPQFEEHDLRGCATAAASSSAPRAPTPARGSKRPADLDDPEKTARCATSTTRLVDLEVDALISIGGDDTLKTANFLYEYQKRLPPRRKRVRIVHLPKTIDNDYRGIDFTFGFFTAVDVMAKELQNLRADAMATSSYFIVETMGRKAGWLSYGVAIAGEAHMVIGVEDIAGDLAIEESSTRPARRHEPLDTGRARPIASSTSILTRERRGKHYGTVVLAEGLAELLPDELPRRRPARRARPHLARPASTSASWSPSSSASAIRAHTGRKKKLTGVQLGYESRCAPPHAFDVMLGSQLGIGAYRALVEEGLDGHMVSVTGQLDLQYVPFARAGQPGDAQDRGALHAPGSDFHRLARQLETRVEPTKKG